MIIIITIVITSHLKSLEIKIEHNIGGWKSRFTTYHRVCNYMYTNTTVATRGAGTAYPSRAPEFTPRF